MPGLSEVVEALGMMAILSLIMISIVTISMLAVWWFFKNRDDKREEKQ